MTAGFERAPRLRRRIARITPMIELIVTTIPVTMMKLKMINSFRTTRSKPGITNGSKNDTQTSLLAEDDIVGLAYSLENRVFKRRLIGRYFAHALSFNGYLLSGLQFLNRVPGIRRET